MLQIPEYCYQRKTVIMTSNTVRIELKVNSMRRKNQKKNNNFVEPKATISEVAHLKMPQFEEV